MQYVVDDGLIAWADEIRADSYGQYDGCYYPLYPL